MNFIPFPDPQSADELNDVLDVLAAGTHPATADNDIHRAAIAFHTLARAANPVYHGKRMPAHEKGHNEMTAATYTIPSAQARKRSQTEPTMLHRWFYGTLVAMLMVGIIGGAWLNQSHRGDERLAVVPMGTPELENVLNPDDDAWLADLDPDACTTTMMTPTDVEERMQGIQSAPQSYGMVGQADPDTAATVVDRYRAMRSCETQGQAWHYWSDARFAATPRDLTPENMTELTALQEYFAGVYPQQFMVTAEDVSIPANVQAEWDGRAELGIIGQPLPLSGKINPEWGVELSDGRIAFPATLVYAANDPAIVANGLPVDAPVSTVAMVFTLENDTWAYDDSLALCLVNCDSGVGNPVEATTTPWLEDLSAGTCNTEPMSAEDYRAMTIGMPEWEDNEYTLEGPADESDAIAAATSGNTANSCMYNGQQSEARTHYTPLGYLLQSGGSQFTGSTEEKAAYAEANRNASVDWSVNYQGQTSIDVMTGVGSRSDDVPAGTTSVSTGTMANDDSVDTLWLNYLNPSDAVMLSDGRIAFPTNAAIDISDRGAVRYAGSLGDPLWMMYGVTIMAHEDGEWNIDELLMLYPYLGLYDMPGPYIYDPRGLVPVPNAPAGTPEATPAS